MFSNPRGFPGLLFIVAALVLISAGWCYQQTQIGDRFQYIGFEPIEWSDLSGCVIQTGRTDDFPMLSRTLTWNPRHTRHTANCISKRIQPRGNILELEYAGHSASKNKGAVSIVLEGKNHTRQRFRVPTERTYGTWHLLRFKLPDDSPVKISLIDQAWGRGWVSVRNRVNFYHEDRGETEASRFLKVPAIKSFICIAFSVAVLSLLYSLCSLYSIGMSSPQSSFFRTHSIFVTFFLIAICAHFRSDLFFHMDEWHVLERFYARGWSAALIPHNEHFTPLFFGVYFLESLLFGDNYQFYILVSLGVHALNGCLVFELLKRLGRNLESRHTTALMVSGLYVMSGLHAEMLQWAMVQSTLFSLTVSYVGLIFAWDYLETRKALYLKGCGVALCAAPLFFGGALILPFQIALILLLWRPTVDLRVLFREPRTRVLLLLCAIGMVSMFSVYGLKQQPGVAEARPKRAETSAANYVRYVLLGSQYGTTLRGLGLATVNEVERFADQLPVRLHNKQTVQNTAIGLGLVVNLLLLLSLYRRRRDGRVRYWLVGQGLMILPFLLTVYGRLPFGMDQSLAFRYHSASILGLLVMLLPVFDRCIDFANRRMTAAVLSAAIFCTHIFMQLTLLDNYNYYWKQGELMHRFVTQVIDWNFTLNRNPSEANAPSYEGVECHYCGLQPLVYGGHPTYPAAQVMVIHPDQMIQTLRTLQSRAVFK